jgi:nicotinamide riboside kinase
MKIDLRQTMLEVDDDNAVKYELDNIEHVDVQQQSDDLIFTSADMDDMIRGNIDVVQRAAEETGASNVIDTEWDGHGMRGNIYEPIPVQAWIDSMRNGMSIQ